MKKQKPPLLAIILTTVAYFGIFFLTLPRLDYAVRSDSHGYMKLAGNILAHGVFSISDALPFSPELFRLPGYPLLLSALGAVTPELFVRPIFVQCLLAIAMLFLAWPLFFRLGGTRGAWAGTAILLWDLNTLLHATLVMPELPLQFFIVLALYLTFKYIDTPSTPLIIGAGLAWGFAALIKPVALFVLLIVLFAQLKISRNMLLFLFTGLLLPAFWVTRNSLIVGRPVFTIQGGYALLLYPAAGALSFEENVPFVEEQKILEEKIRAANPDIPKNSPEESRVFEAEAKRIMAQYPLSTLKWHLVGGIRILGGSPIAMLAELFDAEKGQQLVAKTATDHSGGTVSGQGTIGFMRKYPALVPVQILYTLFLLAAYACFAMGVFKLVKRREKKPALIIGLPVLVLLLLALHQGYYRFRIPMMPFLAMGAAVFFKKKDPQPAS